MNIMQSESMECPTPENIQVCKPYKSSKTSLDKCQITTVKPSSSEHNVLYDQPMLNTSNFSNPENGFDEYEMGETLDIPDGDTSFESDFVDDEQGMSIECGIACWATKFNISYLLYQHYFSFIGCLR